MPKMPNPSDPAIDLQDPSLLMRQMSPTPSTGRVRSRFDQHTQAMFALVSQLQEEHEKEVNFLRRQLDNVLTKNDEGCGMESRVGDDSRKISPASTREEVGFTSFSEDFAASRNVGVVSVRSKPKARPPMGASMGAGNSKNRMNMVSLVQPRRTMGPLGTMDNDFMSPPTSGRRMVQYVSEVGARSVQLADTATADLEVAASSAGPLVETVGSVQREPPRPEALFPRWFNPFVQDTYIGTKQKAGRDELTILTQIIEKEHSSGEYKRDSCLLMPIGRTRLSWDLMWCACLIYEIWITPVDLVFITDELMPFSLTLISRLTMAFFFCDIVLNFFTGFMDGEKEIMNRRKIACNYLKFWFWFDLMATVPWDEVVGQDSNTMSTSRAAKVSKAFKVMKMVKLVRLAKVFHHVENVKRVRFQRAIERVIRAHDKGKKSKLEQLEDLFSQFSAPLKHLTFPFQVAGFLAVTGHVHGIVYALVFQWGDEPESIAECFHRYYESFWWAVSVFTYRDVPLPTTPELWTLEIFIMSERLLLTAYALLWLMFRALIWYEDDARTSLKNTNAMQYLKQHHVSVKTQVQVLFSVNQCGNIQKTQRNFMDLMENDLPQELQRQICEELWAKHLVTLGLLWNVSEWRSDFLMELSQLVREETYASKVIVFREGDAAVAAYMILQGVLAVMSSFQNDGIADFTKGMWLGEKSLINLGLRRSGTGLTKVVSTLMSVPAGGFQALLERMELLSQFQQFCSDELWKGLCGRCGTMGSHFGHECPLLPQTNRTKSGAKFSLRWAGTMGGGNKGGRRRESTHLARDIKMYFSSYGLERFIPDMEELGIENLDDLQQPENINLFLARAEDDLNEEEKKLFSPDAIIDFRQEIAGKARSLLSAKMSSSHHFMFLSHYKVEAGTEAALMRAELEQLILADDGHPAKDLDSPIFLDSEDLQDLVDLMKAVQKSHNLILMLTKGILTRPWCVVEIATAVREGVSVLPVKITKPGCEFTFPDEDFYTALAKGEILGKEGMDVVLKHGFDIAEVGEAIRRVFKRIAVPYSPHRTSAIRKEELAALLRQCSCREIHDPKEVKEPPVAITASAQSDTSASRYSSGNSGLGGTPQKIGSNVEDKQFFDKQLLESSAISIDAVSR